MTPGEVHLDQGLFHRRFPPAVVLDDRRLKGQPAQLRHGQRHLPGLGLQSSLAHSRVREFAPSQGEAFMRALAAGLQADADYGEIYCSL